MFSPPPLCLSTPPTLLRKIVRWIVGEYEQKAVYKRYDILGNGSDSVLETSGAIKFIVVISKYNGVFFGRDEPYFVLTHSASACVCLCMISKF